MSVLSKQKKNRLHDKIIQICIIMTSFVRFQISAIHKTGLMYYSSRYKKKLFIRETVVGELSDNSY